MPRSLARGTFLTKLHCSESGEMKVRYRADRRPAVQRLRVLVNGRNMEVPRTANQEPLVKFGIVPIAEFRFVEMPARYRPFNPSSDVHTIDGGVPQSSPSFHLD